jgi:hypothetical protein
MASGFVGAPDGSSAQDQIHRAEAGGNAEPTHKRQNIQSRHQSLPRGSYAVKLRGFLERGKKHSSPQCGMTLLRLRVLVGNLALRPAFA